MRALVAQSSKALAAPDKNNFVSMTSFTFVYHNTPDSRNPPSVTIVGYDEKHSIGFQTILVSIPKIL